MLFNFLKIAYRNLFKQKALSLINIIGLSIGIACFSLFSLYIVHEFSFDRFHENGDQIYRLYRYTEAMGGNDPGRDPHLPMPLGISFKDELPGVQEVVRWKGAWNTSFVKVNDVISEVEVSHADASIFDVFSFPLISGNPKSALSDPGSIVITQQIAQRLFGEGNPTGKQIEIQIEDNFEPFTVSAVARDIPGNSSMQFQILGSLEYYGSTRGGQYRKDNWYNSFLRVFVQVRPESGLENDAEALLGFRKKHYPDEENALREAGFWTGEGPPATYKMQPLMSIHTDVDIPGGDIPSINPDNLWTLLAIASMVLLIAIINFTTLSVGRSAGRAKEVGIRKVAGSTRSQLAGQFILESILLSFISLGIGLAIAQLVLPYFNSLAGRELSLSFDQYPVMIGILLAITLISGLLAGAYPSFVLSRFKPVRVFRNQMKLGGANLFTKSLVTTQFVLSSGLIIGTIAILAQLQYLQTKNPGFTQENVVVVDADQTNSSEIYPRFKEALSRMPEISGIAASELGIGADWGYSRSGFEYQGNLKQVYEYFVDDGFLKVLGIELIAGRDFDAERMDGPNRSVIINESTVRDFGWTEDNAIGQELTGYFNEGIQPKVIGVVKDFHYQSMHQSVLPQLFHQFDDYVPYKYFVKIRPGDPFAAIQKMEASWKIIEPNLPFKYSFLDEDINRFYRAEKRFASITAWAGSLSILLACLGLLGLSALSVVNRTKEIGIRKVLGANVLGIVRLLSGDFLKLVVIALLLASPLAYYFIDQWLQNFAFRINIEWWFFALTILISVSVAFLTVGSQSLKAAMANPVDTLRTE